MTPPNTGTEPSGYCLLTRTLIGAHRPPHTHTQMLTHHACYTYTTPSFKCHKGPRDSQGQRDLPVHGRILNLISGLDSDEELGLLCHHASYLGD